MGATSWLLGWTAKKCLKLGCRRSRMGPSWQKGWVHILPRSSVDVLINILTCILVVASSAVDPFSLPLERSPRTGSPTGKHTLLLLLLFRLTIIGLVNFDPLLDGDLFDEAMDGGPVTENGRGESSPEPFDLSHLGESLAAPIPRTCRTPEAFLGPEGASLVNLDSLIPVNASAKTTNPFLLSGNYHETF